MHQAPHDYNIPARHIRFRAGVDMPQHEELCKDWPFDFELLYVLLADIDGNATLPPDQRFARDYLLGYPTWDSLAYDPTPSAGGRDWRSLITLQSHDALEWCWQDGAQLMVFIEANKLAQRDFSHLRVDAG